MNMIKVEKKDSERFRSTERDYRSDDGRAFMDMTPGTVVFVECEHEKNAIQRLRSKVYYYSKLRENDVVFTTKRVIDEKTKKTGMLITCEKV